MKNEFTKMGPYDNDSLDKKAKNLKYRITIFWKEKTYCRVFGKSEEEVDARADEIIDALTLLSKQSNMELVLNIAPLVKSLKRLVFEFDGMWELFDITGKEVPTAVRAMKSAKRLLKKHNLG